MTSSKFLVLIILVSLNLLISRHSNAQNTKSKISKKEENKSPLTSYEKYINDNNAAHLKEYFELVSIPTISSIPSHRRDFERAAALIVNKLKTIGMTTAQVIPTEGLPVIYGSWDKAKGKPTVLIYAHYDVQPVKETEWNTPPFEAKEVNGKIFGRGTSDNKSGVMIPIWAVEAMLSIDKKLPMNIKFIFEGEEENGSPNLRNFLSSNKELLKADFALNADGVQFNDSTPSILISSRGSAQLEFSVKTANIDAHSGLFGGKTPNAAIALSQIIASFYNKDGKIAVEGFYDKVLPLTLQEKDMLKKIPYDASEDKKMLGTTAESGDTTYSPLERLWYRPALEVIGMQSGYTAVDGFSNIIPGNAMARINCRYVKNQSAEEIIDLIVKHINKNCPAGGTVSYKFRTNYVRPFKMPSDTKAYKYVSDVLKNIYGKEPLQTAIGSSGEFLTIIQEQLGLYAYPLGFQQTDENLHGANEFFRSSDITRGQMVYCYYLLHIADEENKLKK
jgi:acetylornithine deacetylase/succinyl-diaminopimelate desuccinylase-like protein